MNTWMIAAVSVLGLYGMIGIGYGVYHVREILSVLKLVEQREQFLRDMVGMHNLSPTGAEYYVQLQELKLNRSEYFEEISLRKKNPFKYTTSLFLWGFFLWPYYMRRIQKPKAGV